MATWSRAVCLVICIADAVAQVRNLRQEPAKQCLCIFELDALVAPIPSRCPSILPGLEVDGKALRLTQLRLQLEDTFCQSCHMGAVAASSQATLDAAESLGSRLPSSLWSKIDNVTSAQIRDAGGRYLEAVAGILGWYLKQDVNINMANTFFFGTKDLPPGVTGRQVSCGECGPMASEVQREPGLCTVAPRAVSTVPCLCLFDVDRTLTGAQGKASPTCPGNTIVSNVHDFAYGFGPLTLSQLATGIPQTFCGSCYLGIVSHGSASGPDEKAVLLSHLVGRGEMPDDWHSACEPGSPLLLRCGEGVKQAAAASIVGWYGMQGVSIRNENVYMFDDKAENVEGFRGSGFNARQISCGSRDGDVGLCGAALAEIVPSDGIHLC